MIINYMNYISRSLVSKICLNSFLWIKHIWRLKSTFKQKKKFLTCSSRSRSRVPSVRPRFPTQTGVEQVGLESRTRWKRSEAWCRLSVSSDMTSEENPQSSWKKCFLISYFPGSEPKIQETNSTHQNTTQHLLFPYLCSPLHPGYPCPEMRVGSPLGAAAGFISQISSELNRWHHHRPAAAILEGNFEQVKDQTGVPAVWRRLLG